MDREANGRSRLSPNTLADEMYASNAQHFVLMKRERNNLKKLLHGLVTQAVCKKH
jgi:hypothetical protein